MADEVGVERGQRATEEQYGAIIDLISRHEHDQPALTADAVGAADPVSVPAGQPTGRQEERDSLPPLPAEPTLDDVLSATGGSLEQPDGDPPAAPVSPGEPALAPVGSANAGSSGATRDAREAAAKARARAGR